jgi:hypothetical protein
MGSFLSWGSNYKKGKNMVNWLGRVGGVLGIAVAIALGCESDCLNCHPKLKPLETNRSNPLYKEHHFLTSCTRCHPNHKVKKDDECGADCFQCHSRQKLVETPVLEHQKLKNCTKCHTPSPTDILGTPSNGGDGLSPLFPH